MENGYTQSFMYTANIVVVKTTTDTGFHISEALKTQPLNQMSSQLGWHFSMFNTYKVNWVKMMLDVSPFSVTDDLQETTQIDQGCTDVWLVPWTRDIYVNGLENLPNASLLPGCIWKHGGGRISIQYDGSGHWDLRN